MSIEVIMPAQWQTQRWQNGGGITHQLCRQDNGQGLLWRLSIAEVASDGPFSRFDNIDRIILLLDGAGFSLHGVGDKPQVLDAPLKPYSFAGETAIHCTLLDGAVRDFNLMTRRNTLQAELQVLTIGSAVQTLPLSPQTLVYIASGSVNAELGAKQITLEAQHTLSLSNEAGTVQLSSNDNAQVIIIGMSDAQCGNSTGKF
ncbi:HutD family protein [Rheinheimera hassiensis]|uniref:HutD/Ves family protein n=1 Tax=Rheinheimera hassiensis TaxID=1193627 RepID=UPI001F053F0B|nr:HutD family protein [Rheinheimera hassiensis]